VYYGYEVVSLQLFGGGTENRTVTFTQAEKRENIKSGEKHKTLFGKIARWFADLKTVAFTGNYSDLAGKPSSFPPSSHKHDVTELKAKTLSNFATLWDGGMMGRKYHHFYGFNIAKGAALGEVGFGPQGIDKGVTWGLKGILFDDLSSVLFFYNGALIPSSQFSLGNADNKFGDLYCTNGTIQTSDARMKTDISYIGADNGSGIYMPDSTLAKFILNLKPAVFKRNDGETGRPHHGLIAQDVEKLLQELGIEDHAAFIKSPQVRSIEAEEEYTDKDGSKKTRKRTVQEEIPGEYIYGLRYEEFIADIVRFVQIQDERIERQERKINSLEGRLSALENMLNASTG